MEGKLKMGGNHDTCQHNDDIIPMPIGKREDAHVACVFMKTFLAS